ncbi:MAG: M20/M25/M40 family metallo-hydrolase [Thermoanaerobaculia bacterium]
MIRPDRLTDTFLDLVRIDSESFHERQVAEWIAAKVREMGAEVSFDDAGAAIGGDCGNLFARFAPTSEALPPILLSAHMDTVTPGRGIRPQIHPDRITSDGTTILGADDKSGCAIILEALRVVLENRIPHGVIEVCFSVAEEQGLRGVKELDTGRLQSKRGVVFDSGDARCIFNTGPAADRMEWIVHGLAAHGGVHPENGISAVRIAAAAITSMPHGRIDAETTCNIGVVEAAGATNIVPPRVRVLGEARSRDPEKLARLSATMSKCFHDAVANAPTVEIHETKHRATLEETIRRDYESLDVAPDATTIALVQDAANRLDRKLYLASMGGGCDANVFNRRGIECINLGTGMRDPHTLSEWLDRRDFESAAALLVEIVKGSA